MNVDPLSIARPPLLPPDVQRDNSYSGILKTEKIITSSLTDGSLTILNNQITGLKNPVNNGDAVPKSYIRGAVPGGAARQIQFNDNGLFGGSPNLIYRTNVDISSGTVTLNGTFTDGILKINNDYIDNITESGEPSSSVPKKYTDFLIAKNKVSYIEKNFLANIKYGPHDILNGYIIRTSSIGIQTVEEDELPSAYDIIQYLKNEPANTYYEGLTYEFTFYNNSSKNINILKPSVNQGTLLLLKRNVDVPKILVPIDHILNCTVKIDNIDPIDPDNNVVTIYVNYLQVNTTYISTPFTSEGFSTFLPFYTEGLYIPGPTSALSVTTIAFTYNIQTVSKGIVLRNPSSNSNDKFDDIRTSSSFVIKNKSTNTITITDTNCTGIWTFVEGPILTLPPNSTAMLSFDYQNNTNIMNLLGIINS